MKILPLMKSSFAGYNVVACLSSRPVAGVCNAFVLVGGAVFIGDKYMLIFLVFQKNNFHFCFIMELLNEAKAWIKRKNGPDEVIRVILDVENKEPVTSYLLYTAYEQTPDYLGRILFDQQGFWIYDGDVLTVNEQEQVAKFIIYLA